MEGKNVLITARAFGLGDDAPLGRLKAAGLGVMEWREASGLGEDDFREKLARADAWMVGLRRVDAATLAIAPRLKVAAKFGVGTDNFDLPAATAAGVAVVTAPGTNHEAVADLAVGFMLTLARRINQVDAAVRAGRWEKYIGLGLPGRRVGIVGLGRIGQAVARRLHGFGAVLLGCDPVWPEELAGRLGIRRMSLEGLLREADVVTLHVPLKEDTAGMIGRRTLELMPPGALVVNTARGRVVDEAAICQALAEGRVGGYAADAFEMEPLPRGRLMELPNVVLSPHTAAFTTDSVRLTSQSNVDSVLAVLRGERPATVVNPEVFG